MKEKNGSFEYFAQLSINIVKDVLLIYYLEITLYLLKFM